MANKAANGPPNTGVALNSIIKYSKEEKPKEELNNKLIQIIEDFISKVLESEFSLAKI